MQKFSDEVYIVPRAERTTAGILSEFEAVDIVSTRSEAIRYGAAHFLRGAQPTTDNPIIIARMELLARRTPLILRRYVGDRIVDDVRVKVFEEWDPNEMALPPLPIHESGQ